MNSAATRILVVDDSALYRQSIRNVLRDVSGAEVVGVAGSGVEALEKIQQLAPDLLTLDVQMPDMDGIALLRELRRRRLACKAIMVSSLTSEGAQVTTEALIEGAFDFVLKPSSRDPAANREQLHAALAERILAFQQAAGQAPTGRGDGSCGSGRVPRRGGPADVPPRPTAACRAVILGCSTGGPAALKLVLPKLPPDLPVPVLVVQHMPPQYTRSLSKRLNEFCSLEVVEAEDRMPATAGRIYIAQGGLQMRLEGADHRLALRLDDAPPENGIRPSVDYLLRSVAELLGGQALAVILTGMGRDGAAGCQALKRVGGYVFAQTREDCVVYGMPKVVIEQELADRVLPLGKVAPAIVRHLNRSRRASS